MTDVNDLYHLLKNMLTSASEGDRTKVVELNQSYEQLVPELYPRLSETLRLDYDNCRQSCVLAVDMLKDRYAALIADARQRFDRIPPPSGDLRVMIKGA